MNDTNTAVLCPTREVFEKVINKLVVHNYLQPAYWNNHKEFTVVYIERGTYAYLKWSMDRSHPVITAESYLQTFQIIPQSTAVLKTGSLYSSVDHPYLVVYMAHSSEGAILIRNDRDDVDAHAKTPLGTRCGFTTAQSLSSVFEITDMVVSLKLKENG